MQVAVLGPIEVIDDAGKRHPIGSPNQRLVLAVLASAGSAVVSSDALVEAIWDDAAPPSALKSLRSYVSRLRRLVGSALVTEPGGYSLDLDTDAAAFEASQDGSIEQRRAGLALWRGPAYLGFEDLDLVVPEARRLDELRQSAHEGLAGALLDNGDFGAAAAEAEAVVTAAPLREHAWGILGRSLIAGGRPAEALRAINRAIAELAEAGLEPSPALRSIETEALVGEALPPQPGRPLPVRQGSLVGRDEDIAAIDHLLDSARAVTLVGPGGVGKTTLAASVAALWESRTPGRVRFVELAALRNPLAVPVTVLDGLGVTRSDADTDGALAGAGNLDLLVVLDNCEHLLDSLAPVVERLLNGGSALRVLASSRERLGVAGEHAWAVSPLRLVGDDSPARQLFLDRARATAPDVAIGESDLATVDRIVRRVDGLPLAIEMAASGLATLGLDELADLLDKRLDVLRSSRRGSDPRHRTLGAVIEWSEALLDDPEREVWGAMSVFAAPATRDDITAVVNEAAAIDLAPRLAERSLLVVDRTRPQTRYGMLETIRPQAAEQLGTRTAELHARHAHHFASRIARLQTELVGPAEAAAVDAIDACFPDLRQGLRWAMAHDLELAAQIVADLYRYAHHCLLDQPLEWAERLLPQLDGSEPDFTRVATAAADRAVNAGDLVTAKERTDLAASLSPANLDTNELRSDIASYEGRFDDSIALSESLLESARAEGDHYGEVIARINLAIAHTYAGQRDVALGFLTEPTVATPTLHGWVAYARGEALLDSDPAGALESLTRAISLADSVRNRFLGGVARVSLASLSAWSGEPDAAVEALAEIVAHWRNQGARTQQLTTLRHVVILFGRLEAWGPAAELYGNVQPNELRPSWGSEASRLEQVHVEFTAALGAERARILKERGASRSIDEAADAALAALETQRFDDQRDASS